MSDLNTEKVIMWITCVKRTGVHSIFLFWGLLLAAGTAPAMSFLSTAAIPDASSEMSVATTILPDKLNTLEAGVIDETGVQHYSFKALRGQDVWIRAKFLKIGSLALEYNRDGNWVSIPWGAGLTVGGLQPNQEVQVRISTNPSVPFVAGSYRLEFGSAPYYADGGARGDAGELPLYWATTQVYRVLNWSVRLTDSTGRALDGATATLILDKGLGEFEHPLTTDNTGNSSGFIQLGQCTGSLKSAPFWTSSGKYQYKWEVEYNVGHWLIQVQGKEASGLGGHSVPNVSLAHICYQRMLRN